MKTRIYEASFGQRYAVVEDKCGYTALRKLPDSEYWAYYKESGDKLYMDADCAYWLCLYSAVDMEEAERYLHGIFTDCGMREDSPCTKGEGRFLIKRHGARASAWA